MIPFDLTRGSGEPPQRIHLIGVAGSGMTGIASILLALGHEVSGSDRVSTEETNRLAKKGLRFSMPQKASNIHNKDLIVATSAVGPGNEEYDEAKKLGIPLILRAQALAALFNPRKGVLVCGMHGKTTTSAMAAFVFRDAGLMPSHYVGAEIPVLGANARWDSGGDLFVAEGDESDGTLTLYQPEHTILLNIEEEHLDHYKNLEEIRSVFRKVLDQTRGLIIFCADDPEAVLLCRDRPKVISYGHGQDADYRLANLRHETFRPRFQVWHRDRLLGEVELGVPGDHNALNALSVLALGNELGVSFQKMAEALQRFRGARRRFELKYEDSENAVVDDYGHHPTEIEATLKTARNGPWHRVLVMFQPHRYSRTKALSKQFGACFDQADFTVLTDIYPASEQPIPGVTGALIVEEAAKHGNANMQFEPNLPSVHSSLGPKIRKGDLILSLGAGNIHEASTRIAADLAMRAELLSVLGPGEIRLHEPLSRHTTMKVGGPARFWVEPETEAGFADLVQHCFDHEIPFLVIGRGSNLLVRDGGFPGVVAHLSRGDFAKVLVEGSTIHAGVGVKFKQITAAARKAGLGNFEWMEGIPGNLGGGLRMNAGAMGWQTFDQVERIRFCDQDGNIFTKTPAELDVRYRNVPFLANNYALSAVLRGEPSARESIEKKIRESESKRRSTQPVAASSGCIFKNPEAIPAGRLVEELGLKNQSVGGARVSEVHGNFIVNDGGAKAQDVLELIRQIQETAKSQRGIELETEVQIVGVDS